MKLTPEQQSSINQWNSTIASEGNEAMFKHFIPSWFSNMRQLIKADFPLRGIEELARKFDYEFNTYTVLGSGPSVTPIARKLPMPHGALFCGPTALGALTREGIRPTAVIVADSNPDQYHHFKESNILHPELMDIVLPVTACPLWYHPESVASRDRLHFFLPYFDFMGDIDIGFNQILKGLFPDVSKFVSQSGSVGNLMMNFADMCCGGWKLTPSAGSPDKRVYIALDCSWVKGSSPRAPLRFDLSKHSKALQDFWANNTQDRTDTIEVTLKPSTAIDHMIEAWSDATIVTDISSLGYAINLFYLVHSWQHEPVKRNRYALINEASKLFFATSPRIVMPWIPVESTTDALFPTASEDSWAYKVLLNLIELSNTLQTRLIKEAENVKSIVGS